MSSHNKISDAELAYKVARKVMGWDPCNDPMHWVEVLDEMERRGHHTAIMTGIKDDPDLDGYLAECGTYAYFASTRGRAVCLAALSAVDEDLNT